MAKSKQLKNGNLYLGIALAMMVVLFISSAQTYEEQSQIGFLKSLLKQQPFKEKLAGISFLYADSPVSIKESGYLGFVEFFIRKGAHFISYFIIGGSWFLGLLPRIKHIGIAGLVSWLAATGYAGLDEFHQMLTAGRSPLFQDVMLDSIGALTAIVMCILVIGIRRIKKGK